MRERGHIYHLRNLLCFDIILGGFLIVLANQSWVRKLIKRQDCHFGFHNSELDHLPFSQLQRQRIS